MEMSDTDCGFQGEERQTDSDTERHRQTDGDRVIEATQRLKRVGNRQTDKECKIRVEKGIEYRRRTGEKHFYERSPDQEIFYDTLCSE